MHPASWRRYAVVALLLLAGVLDVSAITAMVFGPRVFTRVAGKPVTERFTFTAPEPGAYVLHVEADATSAANVTLNGKKIFREKDFPLRPGGNGGDHSAHDSGHDHDPSVALVDAPITLKASNTLAVELRGKPGSWLRVSIQGRPDAADTVPPVILATASPAANAAGWNNGDVTVTFTCSDAGSGIATCPSPVVVSQEGAARVVSGEAVDKAGNRKTASVEISIDKTAPAIVPSAAPPANADGWNNTDVAVSFACADALSGVAACASPVTITGSGPALPAAGTVTDRAGNTASASLAVNIDRTAPRITARLNAPANAAGWHTSPVVVSFECEDDGSGVASCPAPIALSGEGAGQVARGVVRDRAGNAAEATATVNIDLAPPVVTATLSAAANPAGWHQGDVTVTFACDDTLSGVVACPAPLTASAEGIQAIEVTVADRAGHSTVSTTAIRIDRIAPGIASSIEPAANAAGWHNTPVVVSFACSDAGSGVSDCTSPVTVQASGANQAVTGTAVDRAGNSATSEASVNVDLAPPAIRAVATGGPNGSVVVTFECSDEHSGVAVCPEPVTVTTEGADQLVEGAATDRAGNSANASIRVTIDRTKPTIVASVSPAPNAAGWHNAPQVVVTFTCSDTGNGIVDCPAPVTVAVEGAAQRISGTVSDRVGNTATATVEVSLDRTAPSITPQPSATGWSNADVIVRFVCADALSGVEHCPEPVTVTADGSHEVTAAVMDRAGNAASVVVPVLVDRAAPAITAAADRAPNAAGWYNAPATVTFTCADPLSGIASCTAPVVVSTSGANSRVEGTATDRAGNTATAALSLNVDTIAPTVRAVTSPGSAPGDVVVSFECVDAGGSGIAICPAQIVVAAEGSSEVEGEATDLAGNSTRVTTTVQVDRTRPTIVARLSAPANDAGWHASAVTVTFECADTGSGIASCSPPATVTTEGASQTITGTAVDRSGNRETTSVVVNLDTTAPSITPSVPGSWASGDVTVAFVCADTVSGIASCAAPQTVSSEGAHDVAGTATDLAGNTATATARVTIDRTAPAVHAVIDPAPNASGWHRAPATVRFECSDGGSGVALCPPAVVVSTEGRGQQVAGTARDRAGNAAPATASIDLDGTAPTIAIEGLQNQAVIRQSPLSVTGTVADALSGAASVTCNGIAATLTAGRFTCSVALPTGNSTLSVAALDNAGNQGTAAVAVSYEPNRAPVAHAGGPYSGETQKAVAFDGTRSADPDGQPLTFAWTFGDGATGTGPTPSHTFAQPGTYTIALIATDAAGASHAASTTAVIVAANRAPTAAAGGPYTADAGALITFSAAGSSDPDGDALSYAWTFGDNSTGTGLNPRRAYANPGTYTASVTVTDGRGGSATAAAQVTVRAANQRPAASAGGPYAGEAGQLISFSAAASSDPDGDALSYAWSFGDNASGAGVSPTHAYAAPGNYNATVTVTDGRGGTASSTAIVSVRVANRQPVASAGGPYAVRVGQSLTLDATGSSDADGDPLTYAWSLGDGRNRSGITPVHTYASAGVFTVTLTVADGRGGVASSTAQVTVTATTADDNRAPVAAAGGPYAGETGLPIAFDGSASSDPDGDALTYQWTASDGASGSGQTFQHAFAAAGTHTVTLTVTDVHGASSQSAAAVTVAAQQDRAPPVLDLSGPQEVLPGTRVVVTAMASDDRGVTAVAFAVDGSAPTESTAAPYQRAIDVPAIAAPGTTITVTATARDAAGNSTSDTLRLVIVAQPDSVPPTVSIHAPAEAAPGSTVRLTATAQDGTGVARVAFSINGAVVAVDEAAPFEASYALPAEMAAGSTLTAVAEASDFGGNKASASAPILVAASGDTTPPAVSLVAPATAGPGTAIVLSATVSDANGVAAVTFLVDGAVAGVRTQAPYQVSYVVGASVPEGAVLTVEARATDFAGLEAMDSRQVRVLTVAASGGVVIGEVYSDVSGLPLAGATVALRGADSAGVPYEQSTLTDERGRFLITAAPGAATLEIGKAGWTAAARSVIIAAGQVAEAVDARLSLLSTAPVVIAPVQGGRVSHAGAELALAPGSLAAPASITLTRVGAHGLEGLTPLGWTPLSVADVLPRGLTFGVPASLEMPVNAPAGTPLTLAVWDASTHGWRAIETRVMPEGVTSIAAAVPQSGQYAWLQPDVLPSAPPASAPGELVQGVAGAAVPVDAQANVVPQPKVIFHQPGVWSDVAAKIEAGAALPSGTLLSARIAESYEFISGSRVSVEPFIQDLPFYQNGTQADLLANHRVTPSLAFEALTLKSGVIGVEVVARPGAGASAQLIGAAGGRVETASGEAIDVPAGAGVATPVQIASLPLAGLGVPLPDDLAFVGGVTVSFGGARLQQPGVLSVPVPSPMPAGEQLLLVRAQEVQGRTDLVLVGLGAIDGSRVTAVHTLPLNGTALEGVRSGGRYLFVRSLHPLAFAAGQVVGAAGTPFTGARVSTDRFSVSALSRGADGYAVPVRTGAGTLQAFDTVRSDSGTAAVSPAATGEELAIDLRLVPQPPRVLSVQPADGLRNVPLGTAITVVFSEPIDPASVSGVNANRIQLATGSGVVAGSIGLTAGNSVATFRPASPLSPDTTYVLTIAGEIADASGYTLGSPLSVTFTSLDTTAPLPPAAGSITADIPGADGFTTVRATQGTAGTHDTVTIENVTTGALTPVLLEPNGGFEVRMAANKTDTLRIRIVDQAGNETVLTLPRFSQVNADGSISSVVGADGGRVLGPNNVAVDVPAGAFPDGATITLRSLTEAQFGLQLTEKQKLNFSFTGGLSLDMHGAEPLQYLNVSVPAPAGVTSNDQWVLTQAIATPGGPRMHAVDTGRVIDGRVTTSSPPCPGVTGNGAYGFLRAARPLGVVYGEVVTAQSLPPAVFVPFLVPAPGILAIDDASSLEPYVTNIENILASWPRPVCLPLLSGRISAFRNQFKVVVPQTQVRADDREIVITHDGEEKRAYAPFPATIPVDGDFHAPPRVQIIKADGTSRIVAASMLPPAYMSVKVAAASLQPADTEITIENVTRNVRFSSALGSELRQRFDINVILEGTAADEYRAIAGQADGSTRAIPVTKAEYSIGAGGMVIRALPGTIDPTRPELDAINAQLPPDQQLPDVAVTEVTVTVIDCDPPACTTQDQATQTTHTIYPGGANRLVGGGFLFAVNGEFNDIYELHVRYDNGTVESQRLPSFRVQVNDPDSGRVRTIDGQVPPRDRPLFIDTRGDAPDGELVTGSGALLNLDPRTPITLEFSEALHPDTVRAHAVLLDENGRVVPGEWQLSADRKTLTFVPAGAISLGAKYRIALNGVTTAFGRRIGVTSISVETYAPRRISALTLEQLGAQPGATPHSIEDIAFLRKPGEVRTVVTALTTGAGNSTFDQGFNVHSVDVTNPAAPAEVGHAAVGIQKRRVTLIPNARVPVRAADLGRIPDCLGHIVQTGTGAEFRGDLAITSSWNLFSSYFTFVDVTNPEQPCSVGSKVVAANPDQLSAHTRPGTVKMVAYSKGVTWLKHDTGYAAYMGAAEGGVFAVDLTRNMPDAYPEERVQEGFFAGDYSDVEAVGSRVLAVNNNYGGAPTLDVFDASLGPVTTVAIGTAAESAGRFKPSGRMVIAGGVQIDRSGDGRIGLGETFTFAYVASAAAIHIFDVTNPDIPAAVGRVPMPGPAAELAISSDGRTLYAGGVADPSDGRHSLFFIDVSNPFQTQVVDADLNGRDDRVVYEAPFGASKKRITGLQIDVERGLLYVSSTYESLTDLPTEPWGLEVWAATRAGSTAANQPPVANAGPDREVPNTAAVSLDGRASHDPDGDTLAFTWRQVSGPAVTLEGAATSQPTFDPSAITEAATLVFELVVADGFATSAPDFVSIAVNVEELSLRPVIVLLPVVPATKALKVVKTSAAGVEQDVTAGAEDEDTIYEWLDHGLNAGVDGVPSLVAIIDALNSRLSQEAGIDVQFTMIPAGDISVNDAGELTVQSPGVQILRARHGQLKSNLSLILAGLTLESIEIEPEAPISTLIEALVSAMGGSSNPPMILTADENGYISDKGVLLLEDVTFQYLNGGTISIRSLIDSVKPAIEKSLTAALAGTAAAAPVLAKALVELGDLALSGIGTQFLDLESSIPAVATVTDTAPFKGFVQSALPGLTTMTGTLDLGAVGKASDSVLTWVLPDITSVTVEPNKTLISLNQPAQPGPTVRSFGKVSLAHRIALPLPDRFATAAEFADRMLPGGLARWATLSGEKTFHTNFPAPNLRFTFGGTVALGTESVDFADLAFGFHVPNLVPLISNEYTFVDPSIARAGTRTMFDTEVVHQNKAGETPLHNLFSIPLLGSAKDETARVIVTGQPTVVKQTTNGRTSVKPGETIWFDIVVTNPTAQPLNDVVIVDEPSFNGQPMPSIEIPFGTVAPGATVRATTSLIAPAEGGTIVNRVRCKDGGCTTDEETVRVLSLALEPEVIIIPAVTTDAPPQFQLKTWLASGTNAPPVDVTADPQTTYEWIGHVSIGGVQLPDLVPVFNKINEALQKDGQPALPVKIAQIEVSPTGMLTVRSHGFQVIYATHLVDGTRLYSNISIVLAGIKLKKIELGPLSAPNSLISAVATMKNAPMVLAADVPGNSFVSTTGQVLLKNATFEIMGGPAAIEARDLVKALSTTLGKLVTGATAGAGPLAPVFGWAATNAAETAMGIAGAQLLNPLSSTVPGVVTVTDSLPLRGKVDSHAPGLSTLKGTLDLGDFGKASDNMLAWVLPALDKAEIQPQVTVIDPTVSPIDLNGTVTSAGPAPSPYPQIRTSARVTFGNTGQPFELSGKFKDAAEAADSILPGGLGDWANLAINKELTFDQPIFGYKVRLEGQAAAACASAGDDESRCTVTVNGLRFTFQVPHLPPFIEHTYAVSRSQIAKMVPGNNAFEQHAVPLVAEGRTPLASTVDMKTLALGEATDPTGEIVICPQGGCVVKSPATGNLFGIRPGDTASYSLTIHNTTTADWASVTLEDAWFEGRVGPSCSAQTLIRRDVIVVGSIAARSSKTITVTSAAPLLARWFVNVVESLTVDGVRRALAVDTSASNVSCLAVGVPMINEIVTQPQQDWNRDGAIGEADQWIEIVTNTASMAEFEGNPSVPNTGWALEFTDASGQPVVKRFHELRDRITFRGRYMLVQNPGGMGVNTTVRLRDLRLNVPGSTSNDIVDEVSVTGTATGAADEAFARVPDAHDTNQPADFKRRPATRGAVNPLQ